MKLYFLKKRAEKIYHKFLNTNDLFLLCNNNKLYFQMLYTTWMLITIIFKNQAKAN